MNLKITEQEEVNFIATILADGEFPEHPVAIEATSAAKSEMFFCQDTLEAFEILKAMVDDGDPVSCNTFGIRWMKTHNGQVPLKFIDAIQNEIPSNLNWSYYLEGIADAWKARRASVAMATAKTSIDAGVSPQIAFATMEDEMRDVETDQAAINGRELAKRAIADLEYRYQNRENLTGISTGFEKLNYAIAGWQRGELCILGARPSAGKTAIGIGCAAHAVFVQHIPTLFVSLEMSTEALLRRLYSTQCGSALRDLRTGNLSQFDFTRVTAFGGTLAKSSFWMVDAGTAGNIDAIDAEITARCRKNGVQFVVLDYVQKVQCATKQEKRTYEVGSVSTHLKKIAVKNNVAILALAQLSREPDKDKGRFPKLCDLADSAQIERDGDCIMLLHRPCNEEIPANKAKLILAKNRDGEIGIIDLAFDGTHCKFTEDNGIEKNDIPTND